MQAPVPDVYPTHHHEVALLEPYHYIMSLPSKKTIEKMIKAFNMWLKVPQESLDIIIEVLEMFHNSSLLIDDIEDESDLRRGEPSGHKVYGIPATINCANYAYFIAMSKLMNLKNSGELLSIYVEEMMCLHRGQGMEMLWRDRGMCPTQDQYLAMINDKTSAHLRLSVRLMQVCSDSEVNCVPLALLIGSHYQVRDDYMNLTSIEYTALKGYCEDLTEGKFSFPVIHSIRANPDSQELLNILKLKPKDYETKKRAVDIMTSTKTFEYCRSILKDYEQRAREEVMRLGGNAMMEEIINRLSVLEPLAVKSPLLAE